MVSGETLALALGAGVASEATGTTNFTSIGSGKEKDTPGQKPAFGGGGFIPDLSELQIPNAGGSFQPDVNFNIPEYQPPSPEDYAINQAREGLYDRLPLPEGDKGGETGKKGKDGSGGILNLGGGAGNDTGIAGDHTGADVGRDAGRATGGAVIGFVEGLWNSGKYAGEQINKGVTGNKGRGALRVDKPWHPVNQAGQDAVASTTEDGIFNSLSDTIYTGDDIKEGGEALYNAGSDFLSGGSKGGSTGKKEKTGEPSSSSSSSGSSAGGSSGGSVNLFPTPDSGNSGNSGSSGGSDSGSGMNLIPTPDPSGGDSGGNKSSGSEATKSKKKDKSPDNDSGGFLGGIF